MSKEFKSMLEDYYQLEGRVCRESTSPKAAM